MQHDMLACPGNNAKACVVHMRTTPQATPTCAARYDAQVCLGDGVEGVSVPALREVAILRELGAHSAFIKLLDAFPHKKTIMLVFEYMETDLEAVIKVRVCIMVLG